MQKAEDPPLVFRFGLFEVNLHTGEIRKGGRKVNLQEQPFQLLARLLETPGEMVTREELREKLWPGETVDFDSGLNKAVKKIREALDDSAGNPRFVETLPRRGYRFIAPVHRIGASSAVTPGTPSPGVNLAVEGRGSRSWTFYKPRTLTAGLLMLAVLLAGLFGLNPGGLRSRLLRRPVRPGIESMAVLPLENLSGDTAHEYFADGMTDALITEIASISSLRVISRTSSMQYKGTHKPLAVIARELGVDALVEGTVMRTGQKVRITAQLIQARDDRHLWSGKYERDLSDILTLQGEVAQAIAAQIQVKVKPQKQTSVARARPVNPQAYEAYLEGSFFWNKDTQEGLDKSIELFTRSIQFDSTYAQAYAGLSQSYCLLGIYGIRPSGEAYQKARVAALKALGLDETIAEAHTMLADIKKGYDWDWTGAEAEYKRALELNPSYSLAREWYAEYLSKMERHEEAIAEARRARQLDPVTANSNIILGLVLYRARRYDESLVAVQKALELHPLNPGALWIEAWSHEQKRELPEAISELEKAINLSGGISLYRALLGHAYALAGKRAKALAILDELKALSGKRYVSPLDIAIVYTGLGDRNAAFEWLEKAYEERTMRIQELAEPHFDSLRSDPRFPDLMRRIGLPE
jgi:TolB-like protein/DNA-binding winged helix-turn-helix (wHTH) protein/Flp pilus assembly protein TadD